MDKSYDRKLFLPLHGMIMEVSKEEYRDFYRERRRQKYISERSEKNGDISYNMLTTDDFNGEDILIEQCEDIAVQAERNIMLDKLNKAILTLTDEEQLLIYQHYYYDINETELSAIYGISQQAISKRIRKIRDKLKKLLEN